MCLYTTVCRLGRNDSPNPRIDLIHLGHDSIRFDSNEYSVVGNRFGVNLFASNLKEF